MHSLAQLFIILQGRTLTETNIFTLKWPSTWEVQQGTVYSGDKPQQTACCFCCSEKVPGKYDFLYGMRTVTVPTNSYCKYDPMMYVTGMQDYSRVSRDQYDG